MKIKKGLFGSLSIVIILFVLTVMMYTNCTKATLGSLASSSPNNNAQSVVTTPSSCGSDQISIGIAADQSLICVPITTEPQTSCPSGYSYYQSSGANAQCVSNGSYNQSGSVCPVGEFLVSFTNAGAITCTTSSCPSGQYEIGLNNSAPVCQSLSPSTPSAQSCPSGEYVSNISSGAIVCNANLWPASAAQLCGSGTLALGFSNSNLLCQTNVFNNPGVTFSCPSGQVLLSYSGTAGTCSVPPNPDLSHACATGSNVHGVNSTGIVCQSAGAGGGPLCQPGSFVIGLSNGSPVCGPIATANLPTACAVSSYPTGLSNGQTVCSSFTGLNYPTPSVCTAGNQQVCAIQGGIGLESCAADGSGYGACAAIACNSGYILTASACVATQCVAGASQSCQINNGTGEQYCATNGTWGTCQIASCNAGYAAIGGSCQQTACVSGATQACTVGNGTGVQTCNSSGSSFGACSITSCVNGYTLQGGTCVDATAPTIVFTQQPTNPTLGSSATIGYSANDNVGVSSVTCKLDGSTYGNCTSPIAITGLGNGNHTFIVTATDSAGNHASQSVSWLNETCLPSTTQACQIANGSAQQTCSASGSWGTCTAVSCASGYQVSNGICQAVSCQPGYSIVGNGCVDTTPPTLSITHAPVNPTIGATASVTFLAADTGSGLASEVCAVDGGVAHACTSPFNMSGLAFGPHNVVITVTDAAGNFSNVSASWRNLVCAPSTAANCGITNGSGQQACLADGSGYGSCAPISCSSGYVVYNGTCVLPTPHAVANGACNGGRCTGGYNGVKQAAGQDTANWLCTQYGFQSALSYTISGGGGGRFCSYSPSSSSWGCDGSCSGCTPITTVTCQ